jgi:hypothetical protein
VARAGAVAVAIYEFRCSKCSGRAKFSDELEASSAGWVLFTITAGGRVKHVVSCPAHRPGWVDAALETAGMKKVGAK